MAARADRPISNIAVAFAGHTASVDIPKARDGGLLHAPDLSQQHPTMLLTPPNSISPTLPPHKALSEHPHGSTRAPANQADSDVDLLDAVEHAAAQGHPTALSRAALSGLEAAGAITPVMLARHHLPDILLAHGPMAIRHVLNHLAQSVPGFSRIPPAKARRLVVGALESRGGGGTKGEVEFEKVGWGRWDARLKGHPPREGRTSQQGSVPIAAHSLVRTGVSPPASVPESYTLSSAGGLQIPQGRRNTRNIYSGSWAGESVLSSRDEEMEDMSMAEHEADKMSLDGSDHDSESESSEMAEDIPGLEDDLDDVTDQEDWAAIGPDALRQGIDCFGRRDAPRSVSAVVRSAPTRLKHIGSTSGSKSATQRSRFSSLQLQKHHQHSRPGRQATPDLRFSSLLSGTRVGKGVSSATVPSDSYDQNTQEREAIEALLRMGSM
ncbi:uncharacterized protein BDZ99DRAFT_427957 [Mytilinidion resinicola]|uniref:Sin3 binding protein-domain-containing protein n=1 Tax=Mytilinidion resinicola TaxID=574789 RepID=A0A6A6Y357_9PEZI|nr:uncharacterized protein BDZ99DRAFT_427957 [Mytilinidion resinicola]KAF2802958.1 hypothetical protein BDZ99DRAFT_427957 [Mytilinidion resinicola]